MSQVVGRESETHPAFGNRVRPELLKAGCAPLSRPTLLMKTVRIKDIMVRELVTISPELDLRQAVKMMVDKKIGCLPVVDHDRLVGLITETDIMLQYLKNCGGE